MRRVALASAALAFCLPAQWVAVTAFPAVWLYSLYNQLYISIAVYTSLQATHIVTSPDVKL
ncbi:hypothetical protein EMIHUDRAFT_256314 [Emiliania huxleyi CCMP1516]|uniref:Uncharacterized protein n=2 Tax=Emiliania huxleyi TaxID=2903 RepID=A0A0D3IX68_EMIH1|nr:hypothetical protein EMIHUDRAFT_256314 [Emiliania huxleyi CCMP1516]EOD15853.1 hypothetical protein EMIHUDRAFT_256314 [Emiliania huxleyi CCMP1516]|eukprot:XP_005768282.1 hypothetical protein EMIHUDRAFT_256314 [Emiliania huxleyi CCMP1516]